jgi:HEAT repeat protein
MTGSYRKLGLALAALCLTAPAVWAQDLRASFDNAVKAIAENRQADAARELQQILSSNPSSAQLLELWQSTDHHDWLEILRTSGDVALAGQRMLSLVTQERMSRRNDQEAISELLGKLRTDDPVQRSTVIRELANNHGEYAVPSLINWLAKQGDDEKRVDAEQALTRMGPCVVPPLVAALASADPFTRMKVARVLGNLGDVRAAGALAAMTGASESDDSCQRAAKEALEVMKFRGNACDALCSLGELYHMRSSDVLAPELWSDVSWRMDGEQLVSTPTPRAIYPDEMSRQCYERAQKCDAPCAAVAPGLARANAGLIASVEAAAMAGGDVAELQATVDAAHIRLGLVGPAAVDAALKASIEKGDSSTGVVLVRALAEMSAGKRESMVAAMNCRDGAIRAEAAIALGNMATWGKSKADAALVEALAAVASREIVRLGFVIDSDASRAETVSKALGGASMSVSSAQSGILGLAMLRRMPGVDAVVIADSLPDVTAHQVIDEIRSEPGMASTPIFLVSADPAAAEAAFSGKVNGVLPAPNDVAAVGTAIAGTQGAERTRAEALAGQAASLLAHLAGTGTPIPASAVNALQGALGRSDAVAVSSAYAIACAGGAGQVAALAGVLGDTARSEAVREAAGHALASIFGRGAPAGDSRAGIEAVVNSDAPLAVRKAAAQALGNAGK